MYEVELFVKLMIACVTKNKKNIKERLKNFCNLLLNDNSNMIKTVVITIDKATKPILITTVKIGIVVHKKNKNKLI
jgi:hypothetical protein